MTDRIPTAYRQMREGDEKLVYSSWIESFRDSHYAGPLPYCVYYPAIRKSIDLYRTREGFSILMAVNSGDEEQIYGWMAYEIQDPPIVYYAYTKEVWRKKGVQRGLLREAKINPSRPIVYVSKTSCVPDLLRHTGLIAKHNPNIVRKTYKHEESPRHAED